MIHSPSERTFLGGGYHNFAHGSYSVLVGGKSDTSQSAFGFLGGGLQNFINSNSDTSVLVGGAYNYINFGSYSLLGGGLRDTLLSPYSVLAGGESNKIDQGANVCVLGGGELNAILTTPFVVGEHPATYPTHSVIAGGATDTIWNSYGAIGGGTQNKITTGAEDAAIPGGVGLIAQSYAQFVAGRYDSAQGASTSSGINDDDPLVIFGNGKDASHRSNAATISNMGYVSSFGRRLTGGASGGGTPNPSRAGTTYADNVIEAWANCPGNSSTVTADVGITSVTWAGAGTGTYNVLLNIKDQYGNPFTFTPGSGAIVATIEAPPTGPVPGMISVSALTAGGTFVVTTYDKFGNVNDHLPFMFHVIVQ